MMIDNCDWNNPGKNPFMGELPAAVSKYTEIPSEDRAKIIKAMETRKYDDIVLISRTAIVGSVKYNPEITNMHFGNGSVCRTVDRSKWKDTHFERGYTYCSGNYCVVVPTVCRNVSLITKKPIELQEPKVPEPKTGPGSTASGGYGKTHTVPEPEGISVLALLALALFTKKK